MTDTWKRLLEILNDVEITDFFGALVELAEDQRGCAGRSGIDNDAALWNRLAVRLQDCLDDVR